jgi:hypothetical protein
MNPTPPAEPLARLRFGPDSDRHNAELGIYVAWLARLGLLSTALQRAHGDGIAALHFQSETGSAFLSTVLHGELHAEHLSPAGLAFTQGYLVSGRYGRDVALLAPSDAAPEWDRYAVVAPVIMAAYERWRTSGAEDARAAPEPPAHAPRQDRGPVARILRFPRRR